MKPKSKITKLPKLKNQFWKCYLKLYDEEIPCGKVWSQTPNEAKIKIRKSLLTSIKLNNIRVEVFEKNKPIKEEVL